MKLLTLLLGMTVMITNAKEYNVKTFGAKGDGVTIDSPAINAAIDKAAASKDGGTVVIPAGTYNCYSIRLKSHVTLRLEKGAVINAAEANEKMGYDEAEDVDFQLFQDYGHSHFHNSLIWGENLEDIAIVGDGRIVGTSMSSHQERPMTINQGNKGIALKECRNVRLEGFEMLECAHFALLATGVDNMTIENMDIDTNRDGLDIDACTNVKINNCRVNTPNDDAIVLKASYALNRFKDCENVEVMNCKVSGYDCGSMLDGTYTLVGPNAPDRGGRTGRIKLGTESSGGYRNVSIHDCTFEHCRGLALETVDGGILDNVHVWNLEMHHIVNAAIFLRLGARQRSPKGTPVGALRNVVIEHIKAYDVNSRYSSIIAGIPGYQIENVTLNDIEIHYQGGCHLTNATPYIEQAPWEKPGYKEPQKRDQLSPKEMAKMQKEFDAWRNTERDTILACNLSYPVPEVEASYPEPWMFGIVPARGMYIRHAHNITLRNIRFTYAIPDLRPLFAEQDTQNIVKEEISEF